MHPADWRPTLPRALMDLTGTLVLTGDGFQAQVHGNREVGAIYGPAERHPIDGVVRMLVADAVFRRGGMLLHGVAVAHAGRAAVFTGHSGAGKSTLAAWAAKGGLTVLADELVAIVPGAGGFTVHGTPWNVGAAQSASLALLGVLAHGTSARLSAVEPSAVLRVLLSNVVEPQDSAAVRAKLFQSASGMLNAVPAKELSFARAPDVAQVLKDSLR